MSRTEANDRLAELRAMPYAEYLQSPEWRERRQQALDWARNACQLCNSPQEPLHVHHRTYDRLGAELPADMVVLCEECHCLIHGLPPKSGNAIASIQFECAAAEVASWTPVTARRIFSLCQRLSAAEQRILELEATNVPND